MWVWWCFPLGQFYITNVKLSGVHLPPLGRNLTPLWLHFDKPCSVIMCIYVVPTGWWAIAISRSLTYCVLEFHKSVTVYVYFTFYMVVGITLLTRICCNGSSPGENIFTVTVDCLTLGSTTTANLHSSNLVCELHLDGVGMSKYYRVCFHLKCFHLKML